MGWDVILFMVAFDFGGGGVFVEFFTFLRSSSIAFWMDLGGDLIIVARS